MAPGTPAPDLVDLVALRANATDFDDWLACIGEHLPPVDGPFAQLIRLALDTAWALGAEAAHTALRNHPPEA